MRSTTALLVSVFVVSALSAQPPERLTVPLPTIPLPPDVVETVTVFKVDTFAKMFVSTPGTQRVLFVHPYTGKPTEVAFNLPPGKPRVKVSKRELFLDYGKSEVKVRFYRDGGYRVDYDR
jgi:hypothetical protein